MRLTSCSLFRSKKTVKCSLIIIASISIVLYVSVRSFDSKATRMKKHHNLWSDVLFDNRALITENESQTNAPPFLYNGVHLWSMRLADDEYFRLAHQIPCRIIEYFGAPGINKIDTCKSSVDNEFSIENTLQAQKWIHEHQNPVQCSDKQFAIIEYFAWSGFGSTIHQIAWAFGKALAEDRIAVYRTPGNWLYGSCKLGTPDCFFRPITNCPIPSSVDNNRVIVIEANHGIWRNATRPVIFQNRTFNWYRSQLVFYLMRYNSATFKTVHNIISKSLHPSPHDLQRPYIAVYVRRSDKVRNQEMLRAYTLKEYFDLFDADARRTNMTRVFINSEDVAVFREFSNINEVNRDYYKLLYIDAQRDVVFSTINVMSMKERGQLVLEFLADLLIEVNADFHVGTLSSNWCRLVDEFRLVLGKTIPFYTPEKAFYIGMGP